MKKIILIILCILFWSCESRPTEYVHQFKDSKCCVHAHIKQKITISSYTKDSCMLSTEVWVKCDETNISLDYWNTVSYSCRRKNKKLKIDEYKKALVIKNKITKKIKLEKLDEGCSN